MRTLKISDELANAIREIAPDAPWQNTAMVFLSGSVAEFWQSASTGSGLTLDRYRERARAFMREGDSLLEATRKARETRS